MTTLKAALQEAYFMELEEIPSEEKLSEDEALTFSSAFERKMKKLIRRADHPIRYRIAQVVACLLLAALLSGCTVLAVSPEARAAFVGWVRETYETWFVYRYTGEDKAVPENVVYRPTWLPEGYLQAFVPELSDQVNVLYTNGDSPMILFAYSSSSSALTLHIQGDTAVLSKVTVNGIPADFYLEEDGIHSNCLVWENSQNDIIYWIVANLPKDTIIKIAESVEAQEVLKQEAVYCPTWLPNGYTKTSSPDLYEQEVTIYENADGSLLIFGYSKSMGVVDLYVSQDDAVIKQTTVWGNKAELYLYPTIEDAFSSLEQFSK